MVQIIPTIVKTDNASYELSYTDGVLTVVTKTINGSSVDKTLSYTDGVLTDVSKWETA